MKRIRKLFLGLIFLTLFGVGFKVEAAGYAITEPTMSLMRTDASGEDSLYYYLRLGSLKKTCFPETAGSIPRTYEFDYYDKASKKYIKIPNTGIALNFITEEETEGLRYSIKCEETVLYSCAPGETIVSNLDIIDAGITIDDVQAYIEITSASNAKQGKFCATETTKKKSSDPVTASAGKVTFTAYQGDTKLSNAKFLPASYTPDPKTFIFLLDGITENVDLDVSAYSLDKDTATWYQDSDIIIPYYVIGKSTASNVKAVFGSAASLKIKDLNGRKVALSKQSEYLEVEGVFDPEDNWVLHIKDINGKENTYEKGVGWGFDEADNFWFTAVGQAGEHTVYIEKADGSSKSTEAKVTFVDTSATKLKLEYKNQPIKIYEDYITTVYPTCTGPKPTSIHYESDSEPTYIEIEDSGIDAKIAGVKQISKAKVTAYPTYGIDGLDDDDMVKEFDVVVYKSSPIKLASEVCANMDVSVNLSNYITASDKSMEITVSDTSGLITVKPTDGAINKITLTGVESGYQKENLLIVPGAEGYDTAKVTVYPKPSLEITGTSSSSNSSSSSSTYKFKVTMPKQLNHGSTYKKAVESATLIFKSSSGKTFQKTVNMTSSTTSNNSDSSSLSRSVEYNISLDSLNEELKKICSSDSETISVIAYANNGSTYDKEIKSEEKTFNVYKITLDKSGNADYTVDGKTVSDYFYGVSGGNYKIVAQGYGSLDKNSSSTEFANGTLTNGSTSTKGSATIQSYQVNGSRTLKAVFSPYNDPNSPSNKDQDNKGSGGSGSDSDYDDVPKTGESKADIWILWSVLFVSIIGAGFMIYKRFGLARAIAETDREMEAAVIREEKAAKKKEKDDKLKMLKDLRNL